MASNPNIILQGQPVDTGNILNSFLVGRKIGQENLAIEKQNKLAEVLASTPREKLTDTLYQQGMFKEAQDYSKNQADIAKTEAETGLRQFERKKKMLDASLQLSNGYVNDPMLSKEKILGGLNSLKEMGLIDDSVYMQSQNNIAQLPDDTISLRQWAKQSMMQLADANKALDMQFPDANAQLQAQTSMANAQLSADTQRRAQDMTAETQRGGQQFNYDLGMQRLENDRQKAALTGLKQPQGTITPQQRKQDADAVLSILNQVEPLLKDATNSYIGTGYDEAARAFGISTKGAQNSAQLKALEGALISKMPKMSGPQSDKDVLLYKQMAGQIGDSTIPVETRQAAINAIRTLNEKYSSNSGGATESWGASIPPAPKGIDPARWKQYFDEGGK